MAAAAAAARKGPQHKGRSAVHATSRFSAFQGEQIGENERDDDDDRGGEDRGEERRCNQSLL